jgi:hypothetical protein
VWSRERLRSHAAMIADLPERDLAALRKRLSPPSDACEKVGTHV